MSRNFRSYWENALSPCSRSEKSILNILLTSKGFISCLIFLSTMNLLSSFSVPISRVTILWQVETSSWSSRNEGLPGAMIPHPSSVFTAQGSPSFPTITLLRFRALTSYQKADFYIVLLRRYFVFYLLLVRPLAGYFRSRYLVSSGWDRFSCVRLWKLYYCIFVKFLDYQTFDFLCWYTILAMDGIKLEGHFSSL